MIMADTSLGRASLSVTADLSGFVSSLDAAAAKSASLGNAFTATSTSSNRVTTSAAKQWAAMTQLEKTAVISAASQKALTTQTDIANRKLDIQARQMLIDSGAAAKLAKELTALEKAEAKLAAQEEKINRAAGRSGGEQQKKDAKGGLKITDMLGIGFFTAGFTKLFDGAISFVKSLVGSIVDFGSKVIEAGSKFQELDNRLKAMTGFSGLAKGLQGIMRAGPSASFTALGEAATRLSALKFNPEALQGLISKFNSLGVALGNPEKILNLIVDKIGDMASEGSATMGALGKLAEEGIPVFEALATRMGVSVEEAKRRVQQGLVSVSQATQAIADSANMPNMLAAAAESANSFNGIWSQASNNIEVLFQNIGTKILNGFGLVNLKDSVNGFFEKMFEKVEQFAPFLEKVGAAIAKISDMVLKGLEDFLANWEITTEQMTVEEMLGKIETIANDLVTSAKNFVNELRPFVTILIDGVKELEHIKKIIDDLTSEKINIDNSNIITPPIIGPSKDQLAALRPKPNVKPLENLGPLPNLKPLIDDIENLNNQFDPFAENARKFEEAINNINILPETPKWKKFLDDNLTPLQIYENELERLNLMLDGTEQGFQAFAIGSANAIKKLKEATGLGEVKFAAAITAGSAEDFKATLDAQNQNVDVQQQIREIMAAAAEVQKKQLNAQIEIAQAIRNQRMPKPVNVMAN